MVSVAGRPFFEHVLRRMKWWGFRDFFFLVAHHAAAVERHFGDGREFGVHIEYSHDGDRLLGAGGALRNALPRLRDDIVVMYGDSYLEADFEELICHYDHQTRREGKLGSMAVFKNRDRFDKSNVLFRDGRLIAYDKSAPSKEMEHIDYGVAILKRSLVERMQPDSAVDLAVTYQNAVREGILGGVEVRRRFYEIGSPEALDEFREVLEARHKHKRPAIFLDRDGTLNEIVYNDNTEQLDSPLCVDEFRFLPGAVEALKKLSDLGYQLIVVTNQPAAAKGKVSLLELYRINAAMDNALLAEGVRLSAIMMCPHHPQGSPELCREKELIRECECRKPESLLIRRAIEKLNVDVTRSYFVGDSFVDVLAGRRESIKTVFLGSFKCDVCGRLDGAPPDMIFRDLRGFAAHLGESEH